MNYVVENSLSLYERNYVKLTALLPDLAQRRDTFIISAAGFSPIYIEILEQNPYTTTIQMRQGMAIKNPWIRDFGMRVRVYRDAQVAEVIAYQDVHTLRPFYPYPNPKMLQPYEKRRVNQFLGEWLSYCLARRFLTAQ